MNYLHAYHAGNFADVAKHLTLILIIQYLQRKNKPLHILDTHAGSGIYKLNAKEALATGESLNGIFRLFEDQNSQKPIHINPEIDKLLAPYLHVITKLNRGGVLQAYPGSPLLAKHCLRSNDRITACELRNSEFEKLKLLFARDQQVLPRSIDSWAHMKGLLPLKQGRGIILIDPPYEQPAEFERAVDAISIGMKRFPSGIYALWYPIKARYLADKWAKMLAKIKTEWGVETILRSELYVRAPDNDQQLNGSGMFVINPPYTLQASLDQVVPVLQRILQQAPYQERFQKTVLESI